MGEYTSTSTCICTGSGSGTRAGTRTNTVMIAAQTVALGLTWGFSTALTRGLIWMVGLVGVLSVALSLGLILGMILGMTLPLTLALMVREMSVGGCVAVAAVEMSV